MKFDVISSGSKGNATLVISKGDVILLDFGVSKKRIQTALKEYGYCFDDIKAFFITHEHSDHANDIFNAPKDKIYSSTMTLPKLDGTISQSHLLKYFQSYQVSNFLITALPVSHDASNPVCFVVSDGEEKLVYLTDTGFVPEKDFPYLKDANYYIFESNYDSKMLYESNRPDYLIRRIVSDKGHLSNSDCDYYLSNLISDKTKEIVLAHLSEECNTPELAISTYESVMQVQLGYIPNALVKTASATSETKGGN